MSKIEFLPTERLQITFAGAQKIPAKNKIQHESTTMLKTKSKCGLACSYTKQQGFHLIEVLTPWRWMNIKRPKSQQHIKHATHALLGYQNYVLRAHRTGAQCVANASTFDGAQ